MIMFNEKKYFKKKCISLDEFQMNFVESDVIVSNIRYITLPACIL